MLKSQKNLHELRQQKGKLGVCPQKDCGLQGLLLGLSKSQQQFSVSHV